VTTLTEQQVIERLSKYEGLVKSTTKYWRHTIGEEFENEDIEQELRIKVLKALRKFDPDHPSRLDERRHVFGAVRNAVTDLQRKGNRLRVQEVLTPMMPGERVGMIEDHPEWSAFPQVPMPRNAAHAVTTIPEKTEVIADLPESHQRIAMMIVVGYGKQEIVDRMGLTQVAYRECVTAIRSHLRGVRVTFSRVEIRQAIAA
jgi:DNA-directed RNA polymerase specialized sigma24 family protein